MSDQQSIINQAKTISMWAGIILIGLGTVALFYLAMMTLDMIKAPEETELIKWIINEISRSDLVVSGFFGDLPFEIRSSDALQYIALAILGLFILGLLSSIANSLIVGGVSLVKFAGEAVNTGPDKKIGSDANVNMERYRKN